MTIRVRDVMIGYLLYPVFSLLRRCMKATKKQHQWTRLTPLPFPPSLIVPYVEWRCELCAMLQTTSYDNNPYDNPHTDQNCKREKTDE